MLLNKHKLHARFDDGFHTGICCKQRFCKYSLRLIKSLSQGVPN